jgi:hypothetical protein
LFFSPAACCWKKLSTENRHAVISLIKGFYESATSNGDMVWVPKNVIQLTRFVKLEYVYKLRACYFVSQKDPLVLCLQQEEVGSEATLDDSTEQEQDEQEDKGGDSLRQKKIDKFVSVFPVELVSKYRENRNDEKVQQELFNHLSNIQ